MENSKTKSWIALALAVILLVLLVVGHVSANKDGGASLKPEVPAGTAAEPVAAALDVEVAEDAQTLTGTAQGRNGPVTVEVVADQNMIYSVTVTAHEETEGIGTAAVEQLPPEILRTQSLQVDAITAATLTSEAIREAVRAALVSGGIDPSVFDVTPAAAEPVEKTDETLDYDVVVVGAGGAGLTAAVRASQEGLNVLVLEKMPMVGGNSNRAEGGMNAAGTKLEKELGLLDDSLAEGDTDLRSTVENYIADTYRLGHDMADIDLVTTLAENSSEAIDWLGTIGANFTGVEPTGGCKGRKYLHQPEGGVPVGEFLVEKLSTACKEQGINVLLNTKATEILMEDGKAVGVKAESKEHNYTIHAKAVVLATGGFGANFELMSSFNPSLANAVTTNHSGATGDGIMMAQAVGADTVDMEQIQLHPTVIQSDGTLVSESLRSKGAIIVNTEGRRFVNDLAARDVVSQAELQQPNGYCYIVFDQNLVDNLALAQKFIDRGFAIRGETYEELAKNLELSGDEAVQNFVQTMEKWNEDIANGEDTEFGRESMEYSLDTAPFYAIKIAPGIHHTMGGIKIDTEAQVIDTEGNVIPGLFAAGETTGGIHGGNRVGGNAVCDFVVFGRIAGKNSADYAVANGAVANVIPEDAQTLTGTAQGRNGPVEVKVVADSGKIYSVVVTNHEETEGIGTEAVTGIPPEIIRTQSLQVDAVSAATVTSDAIKNAVRAALASGGIDAAVFDRAVDSVPEAAEDAVYDVDVVVVGAGGAGLTAAITAADEGKTVLLLESQGMAGGNSVRSTGGMNAAPTEWQAANTFGENAGVENTLAKVANYPDNERIQELGRIVADQWAAYQSGNQETYFDSVELFQLDTLIGGGGLNDPALVQKFVENSESAISWLDQLDPEVVLHNVAQFGGASVKRIHRPVDADGKVLSVGEYVVPLLKQNLDGRGIELLVNTTAKEILTNDNGDAVGVVAKSRNGATITVNASAVVITTGGFGANNDMIASIRPELNGFITTNAPGIQGQGIRMAQAIGADTVDMEQIQLHPTVHVEGSDAVLITEGLRGDGAILVNQEGERFFDEVSTRDKVSAAEFEQTGGYAWLIVDSRMSEASNVIQNYIKKGYAETGESYAALAEAIGAPADALEATMLKWNACVEAKEDADFGRVSFANPLDQAPFYAIKVQPGIHHTMGGIRINDNAQVIDTEGNVIRGLFAAGEVTGGVHGNNRLGGNAVADFVIFGRIAGKSAADYVG